MNKKVLKIFELILVNAITMTRLIGAFILPFIYHYYGASIVSIFIICLFLTDTIDGFLARKLKISTFFGSLIDGVSDKLLNFISFLILGFINVFMFAPLIIEISIFYTMYSTYRYGGNVQSSKIGKTKTIILDIGVILSFMLISLPIFKSKSRVIDFLIINTDIIITFIAFIILVSCLITLFDYMKKNNKARENPKSFKIKNENKKQKPIKLIIKQLFDTDYYSKHKNESILKQFYI